MIRRLYRKLPYRVRPHAARLLGLPASTFTVRIAGRDLVLDSPRTAPLLRDLFLHGPEELVWERESRRLFEHLARTLQGHEARILDVGAYIGTYAFIGAVSCPSAQVFAYEPLDENARCIERTAQRNRIGNVTIERVALSDRTDTTPMYVSKRKQGLPDTSSIHDRFAGSGGQFDTEAAETRPVRTSTLDAMHPDGPPVRLIKVDVEEAELQVLRGARGTLERDRPDVICEILMGYREKAALFAYMQGLGYQAFLITESGLLPEDRPLTIPRPGQPDVTAWRNHLFTRRPTDEAIRLSHECFGRYLD